MSHPILYLIDAHAYIHRAYHALPPLRSPKGIIVNAVYGFTKILFKILREKKPSYTAICFDDPAPTLRKQQYPLYKAHRKPIEEELIHQFPITRKTVELLGLYAISIPGYEADDIIASFAHAAGEQGIDVVIVSGDKDALQLVSDHVSVWNIDKDIVYDPETVEAMVGLPVSQLIDMYALMGDASDNIPGVAGIGPKTALKLLKEYHSLDAIYAHISHIPEKLKNTLLSSKDDAYISRQLVILEKKAPITFSLSAMPGTVQHVSDTLVEHFKELGFNSFLQELSVPLSAHIPPGNYSIVNNDLALKDMLNMLAQKKIFSVDIETTGLDMFRARIVGISFSAEAHQAWYVPIAGSDDPLFKIVKSFFEKGTYNIIGHNLKFDYRMLKKFGIDMHTLYADTMIASYVLNPSRNNHRLKSLAFELLSMRMMEYDELVGTGKNAVPIEDIELKRVAEYSCADADASFQLYQLMRSEIQKKQLDNLFYNVEMPLVTLLAHMEDEGIKLDVPYLKQLAHDFGQKISALKQRIHHSAGQEFNLDSPKQISAILFDKLKLPVVRRTKTGFSTDDDVLETLSVHHELPRMMREYRELQKLKSTYVDAMLESVDHTSGRIHASFNQAVTATGRLSSSNPNLQNIPIRTDNGKLIRKAFIPEAGNIFVSADYSQIDLRVLAHMSEDSALVQAFHAGGDIHQLTASEIYNVPLAEVTDEMRSRAKAINFGIIYGQQAFGLAESLHISRAEAKDFIDRYFVQYDGVKKWIERTLAQARTNQTVSTILGRIRYLPELTSSNGRVRSFAERMAINTPIQGSAADIIKVAMIKINEEIRQKNLLSRILVQVHDDLLLEVPCEELSRVKNIIKECMEQAVRLSVPLVVDIKTGMNWNDLNP